MIYSQLDSLWYEYLIIKQFLKIWSTPLAGKMPAKQYFGDLFLYFITLVSAVNI